MHQKEFSFYFIKLPWKQFFMIEFNWKIFTIAPLYSKSSSTLMFRNAINLKLVVGTYMGRATPVYNRKQILEVFLTAIWLPQVKLWGQLHSPDVNHCILHFQVKGHQEPQNKVGYLNPVEWLVGFEPGTFWFLLQCLNPLGHSPQQFPLDFPFIEYLLDSIYEKSTIGYQ